ncbi:MAG: exodeoxyribonuclease VII small subunit [Ruminococcaceae bacterium]|nr:exodeoxyribonuclease VII small subunit [Oscillospiraceae bacterium]
MANKKETFEENMKQLETIIAALESGDTPLEECMMHFEEGVRLSRSCMKMLDEAEQKIRLLTENSDGSVNEGNFVAKEE